MTTAVDTRVLPRTDKLTVPFVWVSVEELWSMQAGDCALSSLTQSPEIVQGKTEHRGYKRMKASLETDGFMCPVYVNNDRAGCAGDARFLSNGHHRVIAAKELGFTHIPVTYDVEDGWSTRGPKACI